MAKNSIRDYSATNSSNTDIQSIDISEGCSPAGINNAIREVMADLKDVSTGAIALESPSADSLSVTGGLNVGTIKDATGTNTAMTIDSGGITTATGGLNVGTIKEATGTNTAMTIDSDGVVKITQNPCFFIKGNNGAHVTTSPIPFAITVIDTRSGVDLANNKYVIPVAGRWQFHVQLGIVSVTAGGACYPIIRRTPSGGSAVDLGYSYYSPVNSAGVTSYSHIDVDVIADCAVGDSINVPFVQTTATYYNGSNECRFLGYFLG